MTDWRKAALISQASEEELTELISLLERDTLEGLVPEAWKDLLQWTDGKEVNSYNVTMLIGWLKMRAGKPNRYFKDEEEE